MTGEKKVMGRKRVIVVDTEGTLLSVVVVAADTSDVACGLTVLKIARWRYPRIERVWVDAGFSGEGFARAVEQLSRCRPEVEVVKRAEGTVGFVIQPRRWVVERTFGWQGRERWLSREYGRLPESSEACIYLASIRRNLRRLAHHFSAQL